MTVASSMITLYCDGSCLKNPGIGGWAVSITTWVKDVLIRRTITGGETDTTNNRMGLTALIQGLLAIKDCSLPAIVYSDSQYIVYGATSWVKNWIKRGWKNSKGDPVENKDLWEELVSVMTRFHNLRILWVHGHNGNPDNEFVDEQARLAALQIQDFLDFDSSYVPVCPLSNVLHVLTDKWTQVTE